MVARGDIWLISPGEMHDYIKTVIVAPMTSAGKPAPYRIPVVFETRRGLILLDQIRTLDKIATH